MCTLALVPDAAAHVAPAAEAGRPLVEIVVPVHNEQHVLAASIRRRHGYLAVSFPFAFRVTIADNATATWPSAPGWPTGPRWSAGRGGSWCRAAVVAEGKMHWFLGGGRIGGSMGGSDPARQISAWVQEHFSATPVGGATVYDLTAAAGDTYGTGA